MTTEAIIRECDKLATDEINEIANVLKQLIIDRRRAQMAADGKLIMKEVSEGKYFVGVDKLFEELEKEAN